MGAGCTPEELLTYHSHEWPSSADQCIDAYLEDLDRHVCAVGDEPTDEVLYTVRRGLVRYAERSLEDAVPAGWYLVGSDDLAYVGVEAALRLTPAECADLMVAAAESHGVMRWHRSEHRIVVARKFWGVRWIVRR